MKKLLIVFLSLFTIVLITNYDFSSEEDVYDYMDSSASTAETATDDTEDEWVSSPIDGEGDGDESTYNDTSDDVREAGVPFSGFDDETFDMIVYRVESVRQSMQGKYENSLVYFESIKESEKLDKYNLSAVSVKGSLDKDFTVWQTDLILPAEVGDLYVFKVEKETGQIVDDTKYWVGKSDSLYNY